jgi:hypothetical protein
MEIVENRALKLRVRDPKQITSVIPKSAIVGDNEVLVKWDLEAAQVLKNMGIKNVPPPSTRTTNGPGCISRSTTSARPQRSLRCTAGRSALTSRAQVKQRA